MGPISGSSQIENGFASLSKSHKIQEKTSFFCGKNVMDRWRGVIERISGLNLEPVPVGMLFGFCSGALLGFNASLIKPHLPSSGIIGYIFNHQHPDFGEGTSMLAIGGLGAMIGIIVGMAIEHSLSNRTKLIVPIQAIDANFTVDKSIAEQRNAHNNAKQYWQEEATKINAEVFFVSPINGHSCPRVDEVEIKQDLDSAIFTWENTKGVQGDIQRDGRLSDHVVLYGVASQFNSCEATQRFTPKPGTAVVTYESDPTQGPGAQLQFPDQQVEIINNAANLGLNGLCHVLDDRTKMTVKHGYLTPETKESAEIVISQLQQNGDKMEFLCIGNIPKGENNTEKVYEMLVAAPAFGMYSMGLATDDQKREIEFLCALSGYRAQFQQAIQLAELSPEKQVIFKPTAPGLGVFGNRVENVAKAFYVAAKEYENQLRAKNIQVRFQVFRGEGAARNMATALSLNEINI